MGKFLFLLVFFGSICYSCLAQTLSSSGSTRFNGDGTIVLRGTIILPVGMIKHGYVAIVNGRIASVSEVQPDLPGAINLNTHGIILPGFVDIHNHLRSNIMPRWKPGRLYTNRYEWRADPEFLRMVNEPISRLGSSHFCDMNKWGELRALVGGTTSVMTTHPQPCIHGMVRNLDYNSGFYGTTELNREHVFNVLDLPPPSAPSERAGFVGAAQFFIANPFYEALLIHLAEGTDAASREEFSFVQSQSLLNPKGVVIHGIPLESADFRAMALQGTALVWSPRSNLELYGQTVNLHAALDAGVELALAPDWAITGSSNILNELKVADRWNKERLGGRLTDRQLVDMVTSVPAHIAGVDDHVGAVSAGLRADILVLKGDHNNPCRAVIDATVADVELVFINGVPIYGDRIAMEHFWERPELEVIELAGTTKTLATPAADVLVTDIETRLMLALEAEGSTLAALAEPDNFILPGSAVAGVNIIINPATIAMDPGRREEITYPGTLTITALPNPSRQTFVIRTQSNSNGLLQLRVMDVLGRVVETRTGIAPNLSLHLGNNFRPGIYFVEVAQGSKRQMLKLIRQ